MTAAIVVPILVKGECPRQKQGPGKYYGYTAKKDIKDLQAKKIKLYSVKDFRRKFFR